MDCGETGFVAGTASLPNTHLLLWNPPELFAREKGLRGHVIVHPGAETWNPTADSYGVIPHQSGGGAYRMRRRFRTPRDADLICNPALVSNDNTIPCSLLYSYLLSTPPKVS